MAESQKKSRSGAKGKSFVQDHLHVVAQLVLEDAAMICSDHSFTKDDASYQMDGAEMMMAWICWMAVGLVELMSRVLDRQRNRGSRNNNRTTLCLGCNRNYRLAKLWVGLLTVRRPCGDSFRIM